MATSMIRKAIVKETERRGWNMLRLSRESGVNYPTVHGYLEGSREITTANLGKLLIALKLRISKFR